MRTLLCLLLMLGQPSLVSASSAEEQLRTFANCAGRLTAQLEHQWLLESDAAEVTQQQRAQIVEILDSIVPADRGREVLGWRTDARAAQRGLLMRAHFATDPEEAAWATDVAQRYLSTCTGYLLS